MNMMIMILTLGAAFGLYIWNKKQREKLRENRFFSKR